MSIEDAFRTYQRYDLTTNDDGSISGTTETNDNGDTGYPGEFARWTVKYRTESWHAEV